MTISEALLILRRRRAIGIIMIFSMIIFGYFYIEKIPDIFEEYPRALEFLTVVTIINVSGISLYIFLWCVRLTMGIRDLKRMQKTCYFLSHYWLVRFKQGVFDF